jgi:hypothetical protein
MDYQWCSLVCSCITVSTTLCLWKHPSQWTRAHPNPRCPRGNLIMSERLYFQIMPNSQVGDGRHYSAQYSPKQLCLETPRLLNTDSTLECHKEEQTEGEGKRSFTHVGCTKWPRYQPPTSWISIWTPSRSQRTNKGGWPRHRLSCAQVTSRILGPNFQLTLWSPF